MSDLQHYWEAQLEASLNPLKAYESPALASFILPARQSKVAFTVTGWWLRLLKTLADLGRRWPAVRGMQDGVGVPPSAEGR